MVSKGPPGLVDARSPLCCPHLITWGTLCRLGLWMDSEIKRSHFDLNIVPDSVVRSGPRVSRSDRGWLGRWSFSVILLGLRSWHRLSLCSAEAVCWLLLGFGASAGTGRRPVAGAQGYSRGSQKMLLLPPFPSENWEVVSFFLCSTGGISSSCLTVRLGVGRRPGRPAVPPPLPFFLCARVLRHFSFPAWHQLSPIQFFSPWWFLPRMKRHHTLQPPSLFSPGCAGAWMTCFLILGPRESPSSGASCRVGRSCRARKLNAGCLLGGRRRAAPCHSPGGPTRGSRRPCASAGRTAGPAVLWLLAQALAALCWEGWM